MRSQKPGFGAYLSKFGPDSVTYVLGSPNGLSRILRINIELEMRTKQLLAAFMAAVVSASSAMAQGTINLTNLSGTALNAPVSGPTGARLSGARYRAQLWAGATAQTMAPVGNSVGFETGAVAGYFFGPSVEVPSVVPGAVAFAQVRAWDSNGATTYDNASVRGISNTIEVTTGGSAPGQIPLLPGELIGLSPFSISSNVPPAIAEPLESVLATAGGSATLTVGVTGTTPMTFSWTRNGVVIPGADRASLVISGAGPEDEGTYQVSVQNAFGSAQSETAVLYVNQGGGTVDFTNIGASDAPVFDVDGTTRLSGDGFLAQMFAGPTEKSLEPVGPAVPFLTGTLAGYWRLDPTSSRDIPSVSPGASAVVQARVWETSKGATYQEALAAGSKVGMSLPVAINSTGGGGIPPRLPAQIFGMKSFQLTLDTPPSIVTDLQSVQGNPGENVVLSVEAAGSPPLRYQWSRNGVAISGGASGTLRLNGVSPADEGTYSVVVTNDEGSATSSPAVLLVNQSGGTVIFSNLSGSVNAPVLAADGVTPLSGAGYLAQLYAGANESALLPVGPAVPFLEGELAGYWSFAPTSVRSIPSVSAGQAAVVQARAWPVAAGPDFETALAANAEIGFSNTIQITTGGGGVPPSLPSEMTGLQGFQLGQSLPPTITQGPDSVQVQEGAAASLSVLTQGAPPMTYQWYRNGVAVPGATSSTLDFTPAELADSGSYHVEVSNAFGSAQSNLAVVSVLGNGGTVQFTNIVGDILAPVFDIDGTTPLAGAGFMAQLYAGPTVTDLAPVGPAVPFLTGPLAGFWSVDPSVTRAIPSVLPGSEAVVQARVWETAMGPSFEAALANGSRVGISLALTIPTGGHGIPPSLPTEMVGLDSFQLTFDLPPTIITQPDHVAVELGGAATLEVVAQGGAPLEYQWFRNGAPLDGANAAELTLKGSGDGFEGVYWVTISNASGSVVSDYAVVELIQDGGTVLFSNLTGSVNAPVFNEDGVTPLVGTDYLVQMFAGPVGGDLTPVGPALPFFGGSDLPGYWIQFPNIIRNIPTVAPGQPAVVQARAWETAAGPELHLAMANGSLVGFSNPVTVNTGGAGAPPSLPAALTGLQSFQLSDASIPTIVDQPVGAVRLAGMEVSMGVGAIGDEPLSYQWQYSPDGATFAPIAGATAASLTLTDLEVGDSGSYRVEVSNNAGAVLSASVSLIVIEQQALMGSLVNNGAFQLSMPTPVDLDFVIQATQDFEVWDTLQERASAGGVLEFIDNQARQLDYRFYRVLWSR